MDSAAMYLSGVAIVLAAFLAVALIAIIIYRIIGDHTARARRRNHEVFHQHIDELIRKEKEERKERRRQRKEEAKKQKIVNELKKLKP